MKTPLRYQITESDCGSVSLLNCLTFLFHRKEIPAGLVKMISMYTLDCYDDEGNLGKKGTSRQAVRYLSKWISEYAQTKDFGVRCQYIVGEAVTPKRLRACIEAGGCINLRTYQTCEHYVTVTGMDDDFVYLFDPYYMPADKYKRNPNIEIEFHAPFSHNRKVKLSHFDSIRKTEFSLGPMEKREAVLVYRTLAKSDPEDA